MDFKMYVQNVVAAYVERQNQNVIFIKHYNTLDISEEEILAYVNNTEDKVFLYHEYTMNHMNGAYAPFWEWIRQCYHQYYKDTMSVETFLKECGVYSMHIEPLSKLIGNNMCTRQEDVMPFEIQYETSCMLDNLVGILKYISRQQHLIMILSKFHMAPYSTIQLLRRIMEHTMNIHIIIMYNDEFRIAGYKKIIWDDLIQRSEEQNLQLDWGSMDSRRTIDVQDEFWFDKNKNDEYLLKLTNMYHTFALEDASYYMTNIMYRMDEKTIWLTKKEQIQFLLLAAMIDMNLGHTNQALVVCDKLTSLGAPTDDDPFTKYRYYYTCARARMIQSQSKYVKKYCKKCIEIANEMSDDFLVCKAEVLLWSSYCGIGKDIFEYNFCNEVDMKIPERAKKFGFTNFLAYLYVFGFENDRDSVREIALNEKEPYYFNLGIQIGTALGNDNFLMNAYMKNIILYSRSGYHHYVRKMYEKRLAVLKRPNPLREAHGLAGLGYNSIILEDYEKAHHYLVKSVCNLAELEKPDDVMNSLYNLAFNYFVAEAYENAIHTIELIFKMLKELGYRSIGACSTIKLYSIIAISCYYQEEYYNSYYYLSKIEMIAEHMLRVLQETNEGEWDEDLLLYHLVKGMMYNHEDQFDLCQSEFNDVRKYLKSASGAMFFTFPILAVEQAALYRKMKMKTEADQILSEVIEYCDKEGFQRKKKRLQFFMDNGNRQKEPLLKENTQLPIVHILQTARQVGTQNRLIKRENDIKFLTVLQETISRENMTPDDLFQNTSAVLKNSYNLDDIMVLRRKDGKHSVMYEGNHSFVDTEEIDRIFNFFCTYKQAFLTNRIDKDFNQFLPVMKPFNEKHIMTMIGIPIMEHSGIETVFLACIKVKRRSVGSRVLPGREDLMILKFAFSQFCEMMRRIDNRLMIELMNQKLEQSAITDHLTGITNRNGFSRQVEIICSQDNRQSNVILYVDLDNFKYYNDTFGHEIGDLVLVCFAEIFKKMTKEKGLAVRYGGDEFVILLYNQSEQDGVYLAEQIYEEIKDGFKEQIRNKLNQTVEIPEDKKISCSIGIASFQGGSKDAFELALNQADQMLYYVKRNGKSRYKLYHKNNIYSQ